MLFNSYIFLFAFLPITLCVYWGLRRFQHFKAALFLLFVASLIFYSYQSIYFGILLLGSICLNYAFHRLLLRNPESSGSAFKRLILILAVVFNLGILFYFKYLNFFLSTVSAVFGFLPSASATEASGGGFLLTSIVLPLGISFYTFQQLSAIIDTYKSAVKAGETGAAIRKYSFIEYALYVGFFPQLIAGPIVLHSEMIPQFREMRDTFAKTENLYEGLEYFVLGLAKKMLIADTLGRGVDWGYGNILYLNRFSAVALVLLYTLQLYFDFSGYSDMAIGLARLFGFHLPMNFNSPYKSLSVTEFWKRWHITLTRFFTTYVYIPLGGSRKGKLRTYVNIFIVFAISGLWHGAAFTFIVWGILHGLMLILERIIGMERLEKIPRLIRFAVTFGFVNAAWVFFRAPDFTDAFNVFKRILHGGGDLLLEGMLREMFELDAAKSISPSALSMWQGMGIGFILLSLLIALFAPNTAEIVQKKIVRSPYAVGLGLLFTASVLAISGVSTFLYFNF